MMLFFFSFYPSESTNSELGVSALARREGTEGGKGRRQRGSFEPQWTEKGKKFRPRSRVAAIVAGRTSSGTSGRGSRAGDQMADQRELDC
jgi:hypothetical protein